jgi:hypothetical protein
MHVGSSPSSLRSDIIAELHETSYPLLSRFNPVFAMADITVASLVMYEYRFYIGKHAGYYACGLSDLYHKCGSHMQVI